MKHSMCALKICLLLYLISNLFGCGSVPVYKGYSGEKNRSELALIRCDSEHNNQFLAGLDKRLYIFNIDGDSTYSFSSSLLANQEHPESALVEPGRHYITVRYDYFATRAYGSLWLDAEAGRNYLIKMAIKGYAIIFWIIDEDTGDVVGGIPGGEPKVAPPSRDMFI